jgi:hypothetical protein
MIRIVWIAALGCVLALVLYIPSAVPPDRLMQTVRAEHELNTTLWGSGPQTGSSSACCHSRRMA